MEERESRKHKSFSFLLSSPLCFREESSTFLSFLLPFASLSHQHPRNRITSNNTSNTLQDRSPLLSSSPLFSSSITNIAMDSSTSPNRSPLRESTNQTLQIIPFPLPVPPPEPRTPHKSPSPPCVSTPSTSPPSPTVTVVVNRAESVTKGVEEGKGGERGSKVVTGIVWRSRRDAALSKANLGVRVSALVLTLISFSVMAADKTKGWAGDSFERYREYRFCITVNVLAFVYSSFQIFAYVNQIIKGKHIIRAPFRYYFDLSIDQILAYLLLSASSASATVNNDWVSNWGKDPFTVMINGSISMSFLAFAAFAINSLISAYYLFSNLT